MNSPDQNKLPFDVLLYENAAWPAELASGRELPEGCPSARFEGNMEILLMASELLAELRAFARTMEKTGSTSGSAGRYVRLSAEQVRSVCHMHNMGTDDIVPFLCGHFPRDARKEGEWFLLQV